MRSSLLFVAAFCAVVLLCASSLFRPSEVEKDIIESESVDLTANDEIPITEKTYNTSESLQIASAGFTSGLTAVIPDSIFGIPVHNFTVHTDVIHKNEFLADILGACNVGYGLVDQLVRKSKELEVFDVRNMKANRPYTVLCSKDSTEQAAYFIYEHNPTEYVVFDLQDNLNIEIKEKEITTVEREASGIIEHSLSQTMHDNGMSPLLVAKIADVYAWTIDFFHLQKGDKFKVIYEERYADGEFIGIGEIKSAVFNHFNEDHYAFYFEHPDLDFGDFYDENTKSLRKAFLKAPLKFSRISSRYSPRRFHPVLKRHKAHLGTDYAAPKGTPIMSTADGTVTHVSYTRGNGNYVKIRHNSVYTTQYLHMSKFAKGMKAGKRVRQGEVIGYVGSTGLATGPHVCYRFWKNGKQVDPYKQKLPEAEPMKTSVVPHFELFMDSVRCILDSIPYPLLEDKVEEELSADDDDAKEDVES